MTAAINNVSDHLRLRAETEPDRVALILARTGETRSFHSLEQETQAYVCGFSSIGIVKGTRVALMVPPSREFFALTFALLRAGAVPVMIDPGMGIKNLGVCLNEAEPDAFIGIPKAHLARRILGWGRRTIRTTINVGRGRFFCTCSTHELASSTSLVNPTTVHADDPAAILFTSGSTGVAKGAVYTHGIFSAQVEMLKAEYGIAPGEVDLCTFPLFALFGPALGMTCVIPDMNASKPATINPDRTIDAIERYRVTNFFGSPAVIRKLAHHHSPHTLSTLRRVISAGAPARPDDLEAFKYSYLPDDVQIYTPYGATEALPVASIGSEEILNETRHLTELGHGVCVGRPFAGMTVRIIRISDEPIAEWDDSLCVPDGEVGEIVVRGPVVTKQYFHRDAATKLAKIHDSKTGETLHRMGDVGYFDDRGRLWFCGRKSHRVVTPQGTLFTDMVEPIFSSVRGVARTALVGVNRNGATHPVLCIETFGRRQNLTQKVESINRPKIEELDANLRRRAALFIKTRSIQTILFFPKLFPVDVRHNSKIFREKLAVWADKQLGPNWNGGGS